MERGGCFRLAGWRILYRDGRVDVDDHPSDEHRLLLFPFLFLFLLLLLLLPYRLQSKACFSLMGPVRCRGDKKNGVKAAAEKESSISSGEGRARKELNAAARGGKRGVGVCVRASIDRAWRAV